MAFDLDALKNRQDKSNKFIDVKIAIQKIIDTEKFEDELQRLLEFSIDSGDTKSFLYIRVIKTDNAHISISFTSNNCSILGYILCENLHQNNIKNLSEACSVVLEKLESLKLKVDFRPHSSMEDSLSFEYTVENQTYDNKFTIYLDF